MHNGLCELAKVLERLALKNGHRRLIGQLADEFFEAQGNMVFSRRLLGMLLNPLHGADSTRKPAFSTSANSQRALAVTSGVHPAT
jgi:hypothetical protein